MSNQENNSLQQTDNGKENSLTARETDMGFGLSPANLHEAIKICEYLAKSSMVPKSYQDKPQDILVAINFGGEVGLKPLQSMNSVATVNGNPSLYGDAPLALVNQHPAFEYILEDNEGFAYARDHVAGWEHLKDIKKYDTSICVVKRAGRPPIVREFSKEDVATAKLGNVHKSYPKTMRKYRARSRALRDSFPDVLKGLQQAEINDETEQMIEKGIYDDLNVQNEVVQQPEKRETIDIDRNGESGAAGSNNKQETDAAEPKKAKPIDRSQLMQEITKKSRNHWGSEMFYGKIKKCVVKLDSNASNMLDLSDEDLTELHKKILGMDDKKEAS
jgi:hypothetical protein